MQDAYQHGVSSCSIGVACGRTTMTQPPNILILMTNQQKARALRLDNAIGIPAPAIERLAARGVRYEGGYTPHPLCVPARVSLWTGRYLCWPVSPSVRILWQSRRKNLRDLHRMK